MVNCTWPVPPTLSTIAEKAAVGETINALLQDKNLLVDYGLKVQSTKKCYDESLGK